MWIVYSWKIWVSYCIKGIISHGKIKIRRCKRNVKKFEWQSLKIDEVRPSKESWKLRGNRLIIKKWISEIFFTCNRKYNKVVGY